MKKITFIAGDKAKAELLAKHLKIEVDHKKLEIDEIQSLNLDEVVTKKAKSAYEILKSPVLVEDVSLVYNVLGGLPGPLIKWFLEELDNSGLCRLINHYKKDRSAVARVAFCYFNGKEPKIFDAQIKGRIAAHPRGEKGFGWDPIFIPEGFNQTWAEMDEKDAGASSMRKVALEKFEKYINKFN